MWAVYGRPTANRRSCTLKRAKTRAVHTFPVNVDANMSNHSNEGGSSRTFSGNFAAGETLYAGNDFHANVQNFGNSYNLHISDHDSLLCYRRQLAESLYFPEVHARLNSVAESHSETFEWLFRDVSSEVGSNVRWDSFTEWLKYGEDMFLVEGKPGSGKSTLMNFIYNNPNLRTLIPRSHGPSIFVICHFFWLAGTELQRSYKGLLANLLFQMVRHADDSAIEDVLTSSQYGSKRALCDWSESALENLFFCLLSTVQISTVILIDGLDEFDQGACSSRLVALLKKLTSHSRVKVCVSSRQMLWLDHQLSSANKLRLQDLTQSDILKYTGDVLQDEVSFHASELGNDEVVRLVKEIQYKAEGVFLWVKYAVHSIGKGISGMDDFQTLEARLSELPKGMHELYEHIWRRHENYNSRHREEGAMFFHCARLSTLTLFELTVMMDPSLWQHYRDKATPVDEELIEGKCAVMERKLTIRTAGLLVCQRQHDEDHVSAHITCLHRTVHDFLYETEQGRIIVTSSNLNMQDLSQRRIYALVALFMQDRLKLGWHNVFEACDDMAIWEDVECLFLDFATLDWMDCKMETLVRASRKGTKFLPWPAELSVREDLLNPLSNDFTYLLADAEAYESAKTFIIGKRPSTSYLGRLLVFLLVTIVGAILDLAVSNKS